MATDFVVGEPDSSSAAGSTEEERQSDSVSQALQRVKEYNNTQKLRATFLFLERLRVAVAEKRDESKALSAKLLHSQASKHRYNDLAVDLTRQIQELKDLQVSDAADNDNEIASLKRRIQALKNKLKMRHYETIVKRDARFVERYVREVGKQVAVKTEAPILAKASAQLEDRLNENLETVEKLCKEHFGTFLPRIAGDSASSSPAGTPRQSARRPKSACSQRSNGTHNSSGSAKGLLRTHSFIKRAPVDDEPDTDSTATVLWLSAHCYTSQRQHAKSLQVLRESIRQGELICSSMCFPVLQQHLYDDIRVEHGLDREQNVGRDPSEGSAKLVPVKKKQLTQHCAAVGKLLRWITAVNAAVVDASDEERLDSSVDITGPVLLASSARKAKRPSGSSLIRFRGPPDSAARPRSAVSTPNSRRSSKTYQTPEQLKRAQLHLLTTFQERLRIATAAAFEDLPVEWWVYKRRGAGGNGSSQSASPKNRSLSRASAPVAFEGGKYFHYLAQHRHDLHSTHLRTETQMLKDQEEKRRRRAADGSSIDLDHELLMEVWRLTRVVVIYCFVSVLSVSTPIVGSPLTVCANVSFPVAVGG